MSEQDTLAAASEAMSRRAPRMNTPTAPVPVPPSASRTGDSGRETAPAAAEPDQASPRLGGLSDGRDQKPLSDDDDEYEPLL